MPLSRLENFLNVQGNVLYVNPEELDATDDVRRGNSRTRPLGRFKSTD